MIFSAKGDNIFFACEPLLQNIITLYFDVENDDGVARLKVNNVSESYQREKT